MSDEQMDWRLCMKNRAKTFARLLESNPPDALIAASYSLLRKAVEECLTPEQISKAEFIWEAAKSSWMLPENDRIKGSG